MKKLFLFAIALLPLLIIGCESKIENTKPIETDHNSAKVAFSASQAPDIESLKNNPDVIWMGEVMVDYGLNYNKYLATKEEFATMKQLGLSGTNRFKTLKLLHQNLDQQGLNDAHLFTEKIVAHSKFIQTYKDAALTQKNTAKETAEINSSIDTIITFNPSTMKEIKQVIVNSLNPDDIKFFRVNQIIYYDQKEMTFKTIPVSIAPILSQYNAKGEIIGSKALFWFSPSFLETTPDLNANDITWAKRTYRNFPVNSIKVLKEDKSIDKIINKMMKDFRTNANKVALYHTFAGDGSQLLTPEEIKNLGSSIDTIITFDPKTFEEIIQVVTNKFDGSDVKNLRLLQDWVWDEKNHQLGIVYQGFAPIIDRVDDQGNFLNSGPMLVRRVGRDK